MTTIATGIERPGQREKCQAGIDVRLEDRNGKLELGISGVIGTTRQLNRGDCETAGQCVDEIAAIPAENLVDGWDAARLERLVFIWRAYHLNGMTTGCEHQRAAGWDKKRIRDDKPADTYGRHFEGQSQDSWNLLGWIRPSEHPDGLLTKPCPVCGYAYGSAWLHVELPPEVIEFAQELS